MSGEKPDRQRLDKWLWYARFFKTRALAAEMVEKGKIRVNGARVSKPGHGLKIGDVLTFVKAGHAVVVEILDLGQRRGPSAEATTLYRDLSGGEESSESPDPDTPYGLISETDLEATDGSS